MTRRERGHVGVVRRPRLPHRPGPPLHGLDVRLDGFGASDIADRQRPRVGRGREVRPRLDGVGETLVQWGHARGTEAPVEHEMEPAKMNGNRLVRVPAAGVLHRVGVHRELMNLPYSNALPNSAPSTCVQSIQHSGETL